MAAHEVGNVEERIDDRIRLGAEIAQYGGELRQHENDEKYEHAERGKEHESRVVQGVGHLATQCFGPQRSFPSSSRMWVNFPELSPTRTNAT